MKHKTHSETLTTLATIYRELPPEQRRQFNRVLCYFGDYINALMSGSKQAHVPLLRLFNWLDKLATGIAYLDKDPLSAKSEEYINDLHKVIAGESKKTRQRILHITVNENTGVISLFFDVQSSSKTRFFTLVRLMKLLLKLINNPKDARGIIVKTHSFSDSSEELLACLPLVQAIHKYVGGKVNELPIELLSIPTENDDNITVESDDIELTLEE